MNTTALDEKTRLVDLTSWRAIAAGVFVALALQILLSLFGLGFALRDAELGGGYQAWAIIVQLLSIALGAALAARVSHPGSRWGGIVAGGMVWAVALVLGGVVPGLTILPRTPVGSAWLAFVGALLSLGAAIGGGILGATMRGRAGGARRLAEGETATHTYVGEQQRPLHPGHPGNPGPAGL